MNSPACGRNSSRSAPQREAPAQPPEALAHAPQARRIEADDDHPAFGNEHALDLAQRQVRIAGELERMRQDDEIEAGGVERQGIEVAAQRRRRHDVDAALGVLRAPSPAADLRRASSAGTSSARGLDREPAMRHPIGAQRVELRQAELQRVEAEQVGDGVVEMTLLPCEQVLSRRGPQPLGQLYDRAFRHEPDRTPAFADNCIWMIDDGARAIVVDPGEPGRWPGARCPAPRWRRF